MKIGLNGTGLTARAILKLAMTIDEFKEIEIVHVNGRGMSLSALRDRMLYSTSQRHSGISAEIDEKGGELILNGHRIKYSRESAPEQIPWVNGIELVIDSTGIFRDKSKENKTLTGILKERRKVFAVLLSLLQGRGELMTLCGLPHQPSRKIFKRSSLKKSLLSSVVRVAQLPLPCP